MRSTKYRPAINIAGMMVSLCLWNVQGQRPIHPALIPKFEQAEALYRDAWRLQTGDAVSRREAIQKYTAAAAIYRHTGSKQEESITLTNIGKLYDDLGEMQKALGHYARALPLASDTRDKKQLAAIRNNIGLVYWKLGEMQKALEFYDQSLLLRRQIGDKSGEAVTLNNIGTVYDDLGDKRRALEFYDRALPLIRQVLDVGLESVTLSNIGTMYDELGEKQKALEHYTRSLSLARQVGDKNLEAGILSHFGRVYDTLGERQKALDYYNRSLPIRKQMGDQRGEAITLTNIGKVYADLGDKQNALEYYSQALPLHRLVGHRSGESVTLNNMARVYDELGEKRKALEYYTMSLTLARLTGNKRAESTTLNNIGLLYWSLGEMQKALEHYNHSLQAARLVGDRSGEAVTLTNIGRIYEDIGEKQKALEYYAHSLPLARMVGDRSGEALTLDNMMWTWSTQQMPNLAVLYGKQAVNILQSLRTDIQGLNPDVQKTYVKSVEDTYRRLADILTSQGRIAEAEQVVGMLKEEEYLSFLRRDDKVAADLKARISLSVEEKKAFEEYEKFASEITRTALEFGVLEKKKNELPLGQSLTAEDQLQHDHLKTKYDSSVTVFNKFLDDLKVRFSQRDIRVAAVESDTQGLLKKLGQPRTVILSTIVGEDRLNLILTTSDIQKAHTVDIKAADLNKLVAEFRDAVKSTRSDPRVPGRKLYDKLFPPALQKDLENIKADTIVWSLDGTLRYVPMAALWDGTKYMAERFSNAVLTLASRDKLGTSSSSETKAWQAFAVGASKPFENFNPLPAVPRELCSVVNDPKKKEFCSSLGQKNGGVIDGLMLADDEFTLAGFRNNLGKTQVVHIASHFSLNPGNEVDSYLLLGGGADRRFSLDDLRKTRLDNVDLLTLSACNTAMTSGDKSNGVEVEGFGALAQKQGARAVLATLWAVADESTSMFMREFYTLKKANQQMSKSEAMRLTQKAMIDGKIKSTGAGGGCRADTFTTAGNDNDFKCDPNAPFSHPYFWSPFVLIGNWR